MNEKLPPGVRLVNYDELRREGIPNAPIGREINHPSQVPVNPELPDDFDITPNSERPAEQIEKWWDQPFIRTVDWEDMTESYEDYQERMKDCGGEPKSRLEFEADKAERKEDWYQSWPSGTRYDVRCLDGGAWDRSTNWGMVASLEAALEIAINGPRWVR